MRRAPDHFCAVQLRLVDVAAVLVLCVVVSGCVYALRPYNQPSREKLRLLSITPSRYHVRVDGKVDYPVALDGRVDLDVPRLQRGCAVYLFDVIKLRDGSPYNSPVVCVKRGNRVIRKLSLNELAKLPVDHEGYHLLRIK